VLMGVIDRPADPHMAVKVWRLFIDGNVSRSFPALSPAPVAQPLVAECFVLPAWGARVFCANASRRTEGIALVGPCTHVRIVQPFHVN
jgi:hypothetical protein